MLKLSGKDRLKNLTNFEHCTIEITVYRLYTQLVQISGICVIPNCWICDQDHETFWFC